MRLLNNFFKSYEYLCKNSYKRTYRNVAIWLNSLVIPEKKDYLLEMMIDNLSIVV